MERRYDPSAPEREAMTESQPTPIVVTASAVKVVSRDTVKTIVVAGFAFVASQLVHSDIALAAVLPLGGLLGMWAYSVIERLHNWRIMKHLADHLPDEVATVGHPK